MTSALAVINAGSSSIKFALYETCADSPLLFKGQVEGIGSAPKLHVKGAAGEPVIEREWSTDLGHREATHVILETAVGLVGHGAVRGVGHRVVHGGTRFSDPVLVTPEVVKELKTLVPLAPLHQPHNLAAIEAVADAAPHMPQVACFDTAFHHGQPPIAQIYALPRGLTDGGIRRYGFHGLSYEFVTERLRAVAPELARGRTIIAHLGNGASLCAVKEGRSHATTMGFTAVDGLVMGTRCGSIDPGVILYLMDEHGMDARAIETLIYKKSGLLGVSGLSSDMRMLSKSDDPAAKEAIDLFVYRIVREIGALAATLGGLDGLVFTGGIGENASDIRRRVAKGCAWLGAALDDEPDGSGERRIDGARSSLQIWVIPTDEERMIARHLDRLTHVPTNPMPAPAL